jgi:hypothetical protein
MRVHKKAMTILAMPGAIPPGQYPTPWRSRSLRDLLCPFESVYGGQASKRKRLAK